MNRGQTEPAQNEIWKVVEAKNKKKKPSNQTDQTGTQKKPQRRHTVCDTSIPAKGTAALKTLSDDPKPSKKHKQSSVDITDTKPLMPSKKFKLDISNLSVTEHEQWGFVWSDYSCAYDALFGILLKAFQDSQHLLKASSTRHAPLLALLSQRHLLNDYTNDNIRDLVREKLHSLNPSEFPLHSSQGTDINVLADYAFNERNNIYYKQHVCTQCGLKNKTRQNKNMDGNFVMVTCSSYRWRKQGLITGRAGSRSPLDWVRANLRVLTKDNCSSCKVPFVNETMIISMPTFVRFKIENIQVRWTYTVDIEDAPYRLCGFIYYGNNHFTTRIVTTQEKVWFNDGLQHHATYQYENYLENMKAKDLAQSPDGRKLVMAIYAKI